jgi:uncharacterized repeat protein (TIGR01451 family)
MHAKPIEGGYYTNFDPHAVSLEVTPTEFLSPVRRQHVLVATVRDDEGEPLANRRVEWMISEGSVGDFVEVDESGWRASRGHKLTNHYAVTHTNNFEHVLTRGTDDPADDIHLNEGDTWAVITSPIEGTTHVVAYAPGIYDWNKHKVFVTTLWQDVQVSWPADATNPVETPHEFTTVVTKHSDGTPLSGYIVNYSIKSGPAATLSPGGGQFATVTTGPDGSASVTLNQSVAAEGINEVEIDVIRPADECCSPEAHIGTEVVTKQWLAPQISITKQATPAVLVDQTIDYNIVVSNPSRVDAKDVVVEDTLPDGIVYVSSSPSAQVNGQSMSWSVGTLAAGAQHSISVQAKGTRTGTFQNCADVRAAMGLSDRACDDTVITAPALALELECPAEVLTCDPIELRYFVRNTGDGTATNVKVTGQLPNGMVTDAGQSTISFDAGTLEAGMTKQATINVRANNTGQFDNTATATADGGLTADANCVTVVKKPELTVSKTGPNMRFVGRPAKFEIVVTNTSDVAARDAVLVDTLPPGVEVENISDGGQLNQGTITWQLGTLQAGGAKTVTMSIVSRERGVVRNSAQATAYCAEASDQAETKIEGIPAILLEVIDVEDPIEEEDNITYEITVTNQGSGDGTNIAITATLPPELDYVSARGPTQGAVQGKTITFAPLPLLNPREQAKYFVVGKGNAIGDVRFRVTMTTNEMQGPPVEETESTHIY